MSGISLPEAAAEAQAQAQGAEREFVLLGMPDVHGLVKGKALRPKAFEAALARGR